MSPKTPHSKLEHGKFYKHLRREGWMTPYYVPNSLLRREDTINAFRNEEIVLVLAVNRRSVKQRSKKELSEETIMTVLSDGIVADLVWNYHSWISV